MSAFDFDSWVIYSQDVFRLSSLTFPDRALYKVLLSDSSDLLSTMTIADLIKREKLGYTRFALTYTGSSTFNVATRRATAPDQSISFSGGVSGLSFRSLIWLADCPDANPGVTVSAVNTGTDTLTATAHGRVDEDPVMISSSGAGGVPAGTSDSTIYYADVTDADNLRLLATPGGSVVNLTSVGSGTLTLRFAQGRPVKFLIRPSVVTILPGSTQYFNLREKLKTLN